MSRPLQLYKKNASRDLAQVNGTFAQHNGKFEKQCATLSLISSFFQSFFIFFSVLLDCYIVINSFRYQICSLKCPDRSKLDNWFKSYEVKPLKNL